MGRCVQFLGTVLAILVMWCSPSSAKSSFTPYMVTQHHSGGEVSEVMMDKREVAKACQKFFSSTAQPFVDSFISFFNLQPAIDTAQSIKDKTRLYYNDAEDTIEWNTQLFADLNDSDNLTLLESKLNINVWGPFYTANKIELSSQNQVLDTSSEWILGFTFSTGDQQVAYEYGPNNTHELSITLFN